MGQGRCTDFNDKLHCSASFLPQKIFALQGSFSVSVNQTPGTGLIYILTDAILQCKKKLPEKKTGNL
jgi:hypothetical protein